jgi:hypothetical protein
MQHTFNLWFSITLYTFVLAMVSIEPLYTFVLAMVSSEPLYTFVLSMVSIEPLYTFFIIVARKKEYMN